MHVSPPGHAPSAHLSGGQAAGRLHRSQQPEPGRVRVRGDPAQLVRVGADHGVKDFAGLVDPGSAGPNRAACPLDGSPVNPSQRPAVPWGAIRGWLSGRWQFRTCGRFRRKLATAPR